jgi:hypothetical protein
MAVSKYSVVEAGNLGLGQAGSVFTDIDGAIKPPTGTVFVAITFLDDTTFDTSGGLVAEDSADYANTEAAAHSGTQSTSNGTGGDQIDVSNTFPAGVTIFGRWTEINLGSGMVIAYIG